MRFIKGLMALLAAITIVAGGAFLLARFGRLDAFAGLTIGELFTGRDDGSFALGVLTVIGWAAWGLLVASFLADLITSFSQGSKPVRLPVVSWFHPLTAVFVAAIVAMIHAPITPAFAQPDAPSAPSDEPTTRTSQQEKTPAVASTRSAVINHIVEPGDDLWSLAQRYYGDGSGWRKIAEANNTILLNGTDHLSIGMVLAIPDAESPSEIRIAEGDTLSKLAETHLGDGDRWPEIATANPELQDPDLIAIGDVIQLPSDTQSGSDEAHKTPTETPTLETASGTSAESKADESRDHSAAPRRSTETATGNGLETAQNPGEAGRPEQHSSAGSAQDQDEASAQATEVAAETASTAGDRGPAPARGLETCPIPSGAVANQISKPGQALLINSPMLPAALSASLLGGLLSAFALRRSRQLFGRPVGRRLPIMGAEAATVQAQIAARALDEFPTPHGAIVEFGAGVERDLIADGLTQLIGPDGLAADMANALATQLATTLADREAEIICAGPSFSWLASLDEPLLETCSTASGDRRITSELDAREAAVTRGDTQAADLPPLILFTQSTALLPAAELLTKYRIGVVQCLETEPISAARNRVAIGDSQAQHSEIQQVFTPALLPTPARRVLTEIFETVTATQYPPAPWWQGSDLNDAVVVPALARSENQPEVSPMPGTSTKHPVVGLLGPIELDGARGQTPPRATKQCIEYAAWLLQHPGSTSQIMADSLVVAETTRRSNMSRLRTWLGHDDVDIPYLPEAYSGRITLNQAVTSDWEQFQIILSGGVDRATNESLRKALELVRGAPLADAAPGQWVWAEQLRHDMIAMITDAAVVLARRALEYDDLETASWAIERGEVANPDDESLLATTLLLADKSGDQQRIDALVLQITRRARLLGVDLRPETVEILQKVVEGNRRTRAL